MKTRVLKRVVLLLAVVFTFGMISITAEASNKTSKVTMIKGEEVAVSFYGGKLSKVSTSKKSVVTVKKSKGKAIIKAKKKGKAKIVCKTTRGSITYNISVENPNFDFKLTQLEDDKYAVTFKNNTSAYFDSITIKYAIKDKTGAVVDNKRTSIFYKVGAKKTAYDTVYLYAPYGIDKASIDYSKTSYTIYNASRSLDFNYDNKDYTKKVNYSIADKGTSIEIKTKTSYKGKGNVYAGFSVAFYDATGKMIYVDDFYNLLYKKRKSATYQMSKPSNAFSWKIINKRAYVQTYK